MNKVTIIINGSDTKTDKRGRSDKVIFCCDKGGKYKEGDSVTQSATKKCGCPFKIRSTPSKDDYGWKIDVKCGFLNHGLPDRFEGPSFVGRLNADEQFDKMSCSTKTRTIFIARARSRECDSGITQIYKHKSKIQIDIMGPRTEMQHLFKLIEDSDYVYWNRKKDELEVVRDISWAHPESVKLLNTFPNVLIMFPKYVRL
ncbi:uncharacterized protein LOC127096255 [Lathyrus oleraceus]|uniref:uncharacterized protein LOC127096255 n=1 Tax=Pisum sativum TaxID=3888 RepID=UPI0021CE15B1|nr:uncharacterized protein LOC127096255 [Pisum sativum]